MADFPTSILTWTTLSDNDDAVLAAHPNSLAAEIIAIESKVGVDDSAITDSHDYLLSNLPNQDGTTVVTNLNADKVDGKDSSDLVQMTGNQTIAGIKTFSSYPVLPGSSPSSNTQGASKGYADAASAKTYVWYQSGALSIASNVGPRLYVRVSGTIVKAIAYVGTAPTGQAIIIDILNNGSSIVGGTFDIAAGAHSATHYNFYGNEAVAQDDYLTMDITQVGNTVAGANLTVLLEVEK